ncbi:unnamed protein product, partial [Tetraodon nigroviridis]
RHRNNEDLQPERSSSGCHHHVLHSPGRTPGDPGGFLPGFPHAVDVSSIKSGSQGALPPLPMPFHPGTSVRQSDDLHGAAGGEAPTRRAAGDVRPGRADQRRPGAAVEHRHQKLLWGKIFFTCKLKF